MMLRFSGWELEKTLETSRPGSGDDVGDLTTEEWRQHWRLSDWGLEMTLEIKRLGSGDDVEDLATGE